MRGAAKSGTIAGPIALIALTGLAAGQSPERVKTLAPPGAIKATGTWSLGARAGDFVYVAGMRGIDPATNMLVQGEEARIRQGFLNMRMIAEDIASAVHDVSDGGLLPAIAEMAMASGIGAELDRPPLPAHAFWFGEDQARYVITVAPGVAEAVLVRARAAGVPARQLGLTGGDALTLEGERPILVARLRERFEGWLPAYMAGQSA